MSAGPCSLWREPAVGSPSFPPLSSLGLLKTFAISWLATVALQTLPLSPHGAPPSGFYVSSLLFIETQAILDLGPP